MVEPANIIQRAYENKQVILRSTHRILDLAGMNPDYKGKEGVNKEIIKEINTITSRLSELKDHAPLFEKNRVSAIIKYGVEISIIVDSGITLLTLLNLYCIAVNSIEIKPTRKSYKVVVGADLGRLKALMSKEENNY